MFENLFESASPKAVKLRHLKFVGIISLVWVFMFFGTLVEEIVLASTELNPQLEIVIGRVPFWEIPSRPLTYPNSGMCRKGPAHLEIRPSFNVQQGKNVNWLERHAIKKVYPPNLECVTSTYVVEITVSAQGEVTSVSLLEGYRFCLLAKQVKEAASKWKFRPFMVNGKPREAVGILKFRYVKGCSEQHDHSSTVYWR